MVQRQGISIHVLREEDDVLVVLLPGCQNISIHVLREEDDSVPHHFRLPVRHFYPRPPQGGRLYGKDWPGSVQNISIHVLRKEDDQGRVKIQHNHDISIHVLRKEDDALSIMSMW